MESTTNGNNHHSHSTSSLPKGISDGICVFFSYSHGLSGFPKIDPARESPHSCNFYITHRYNCSILLVVTVVNLSLCLI